MDNLDVEVLEKVFYVEQAVWFATLSALALLVYDWIVTLADEVDLVWHSPWTIAKALFLLNRYLCLLYSAAYTAVVLSSDPSRSSCKAEMYLQAYGEWLSLVVIELLLQFWLSAICQLSWKQLLFMSTIYAILTATSAATMTKALEGLEVELQMPACLYITPSVDDSVQDIIRRLQTPRPTPGVFIALIPSMVYQLCLLAVLVWKAWKYYRAGRTAGAKRSCESIAGVLLRDSVVYFVITFIIHLSNALMWTLAPTQLFSVGVGVGLALPSILGSHLLLDLRSVYQNDSTGRELFPTSQLSAIRFHAFSAMSSSAL